MTMLWRSVWNWSAGRSHPLFDLMEMWQLVAGLQKKYRGKRVMIKHKTEF